MKIENFDLQSGRTIARKYVVSDQLGKGWEGEVYKIIESSTGIPRAAKVFYPHRNVNGKAAKLYANKLHKLRNCPIIIQYHNQETITFKKTPITVLISEYVEGEILADFIRRQRGKRLSSFEAAHLLYELIKGIEDIHRHKEFHGDLHDGNVMIHRVGLGFRLKLIDFYHRYTTKRENIQQDIIDAVRVFYDVLGGQKHYRSHPQNIKAICCGLKHGLILKKFPTATKLKNHLETMAWE